MTEPGRCAKCGAPLPDSVRGGLCPACLLKRGLEADTAGFTGEDQAEAAAHWTLPTLEQLAPRFPELDLLELIGRGGMGAVYKAREKALDRLVALKILPPEIGCESAFAQRFAREAQAMARLSHPHIVTIYSFGSRSLAAGAPLGAAAEPAAPAPAGDLYFLIMEYVDGLSLRQLLDTGTAGPERSRGVSPKEALAIVPQICDALQYAHDRGIVHRDIKPENILLNRQGQVKIADFGLAKLVGWRPEAAPSSAAPAAAEASTSGAGGTPDVTQAGERVMGTPHYMAPEQLERPREVDHRADIYSLGVVFYQMLTGELPRGRFEPPSRKVLIDVRLDEVVLRALEREPARRYQQVSEVRTQVETIVAGNAPAGPSTRQPIGYGWEYRSKRTLWGLPLLHIAEGYDPDTGKARRAKGIIAYGGIAKGVVAVGGRATGIVAFGGMAVGVIAFGGLSLGLIGLGGAVLAAAFGYGGITLAPVVVGGVAAGLYAQGGFCASLHRLPDRWTMEAFILFYVLSAVLGGAALWLALLSRRHRPWALRRPVGSTAEPSARPAWPRWMAVGTGVAVLLLGAVGLVRLYRPVDPSASLRRTAQAFLTVMRDKDLETMKVLSLGSVRGWISDEQSRQSGAEPLIGMNVHCLEKVIREAHKDVFEADPDRVTKIEETAIDGDWAAAKLPWLGHDSYVIFLFLRTGGHWRFVTVNDARKPLAEELTARIPRLQERLAGRPAAIAVNVDVAVCKAVTGLSVMQEGDPRVADLLQSLRELPEPAVVGEVTKYLDSDKSTLRRAALFVLWKGEFHDLSAAVPALMKLTTHPEEYTRGMAVLAMGEAKVSQAFEVMAGMATDDPSAFARRCAAYALGLLGDSRARPILGKALQDSDFNVRNNAEAALTLLDHAAVSRSVAPSVLATTPAAFATDVDPALDRITVTFDQPMKDRRWSFTAGDPAFCAKTGSIFPERSGEIAYDAARTTCTLPVKLQPGKVYWVGINSPQHRNFQSEGGVPARSYQMLFATRSADGKPTPLPDDLVEQARAINAAPVPKIIGTWDVIEGPSYLTRLRFLDSGLLVATVSLDGDRPELQTAIYRFTFEGDHFTSYELHDVRNIKPVDTVPIASLTEDRLTLAWKDSTYTLARVQDSANTSASPRLSATAAVAAAQAWLGLLDEGRFDQAWEQAAPALRSATAKDPWIEALQSTRAPLGKFKSRRPLSTTHTVSVRESPDGQQVSIQFETHFENQPQAIEAVTLLRNPDGVWQVSEYRVP